MTESLIHTLAKETVGQVACLAGNMPLDILCTGTPGFNAMNIGLP